MENLTVLARGLGDLAFPLVELTKCHRIAVEGRKAAAIFEYRKRQEIRVATACGPEFQTFHAGQFFKQRSCLAVSCDIFFQGSEPKNFVGIIQTSMRDFAHENQDELKVL